MNEYKEAIYSNILHLKLLGFKPLHYKKIWIFFHILSLTIISCLVLLYFISEGFTFQSFVLGMDSIALITQATGKIFALLHEDEIKILFKKIEQFWTVEDIQDKTLKRECADLIMFAKLVSKAVGVWVVLGGSVYVLRPLITEESVFVCYTPEFLPNTMFYLLMYYVLALVVGTIGGFTAFVLSLISCIQVQFKILNHSFASLKLESIKDKNEERKKWSLICKLVDHHNLLFECCDQLNKILSEVLIIDFGISIISLCLGLYCINASNNTAEIIRCAVTCLGILGGALCFYCKPAENIYTEAGNTVNSVYQCDWYNCDSMRIRKAIQIVMVRCTLETMITAGKMINVNLTTFTWLFKTSFSFFSSLNAIS